jgi:LCP family protein required for cell wall assembly
MSRSLLAAISAILVLVVSGCGDLAAGARQAEVDGAGKVAKAAKAAPTPEPTEPPIRVEDLLGSDGRLTVLILGSDQREGVIGTRTDAIIAATVDPASGRVAMVSLPRDTVNVPIAPGVAYPGRVNSLFWEYERKLGKTKPALKRFKNELAYAFGTEIDYYAMVEFDGLVRLVNSIGGIDLMLEEALVDKSMHLGDKGLKLKAGKRHLDGKMTLAFSRSRHTSTDYDRSRRQQQVLTATAAKVRKRGAGQLPSLVEVARSRVVTDMPLRAAPALLELALDAKLEKVKSVVLEPGRYARELPGTYTITPRVVEVQKLFDRLFKPVQ